MTTLFQTAVRGGAVAAVALMMASTSSVVPASAAGDCHNAAFTVTTSSFASAGRATAISRAKSVWSVRVRNAIGAKHQFWAKAMNKSITSRAVKGNNNYLIEVRVSARPCA